MRYAEIRQGLVVNVIECEPAIAQMLGVALAADEVAIGWHYDGAAFTAPVPPPPTVADFVAALEAHYDAKAQERSYDNRLTCALRAGYPGPFQGEGTAFAVWMDTCNAYAYTVLDSVQAGQRAMPATPAALIAELPALVWPS